MVVKPLGKVSAAVPQPAYSLPRLHKIGPGGRCVCKRGKGFRRNGCFRCRDCTKSALEGGVYANAARVFAETDAFTAAIARNRPWRAFCLQTRQGFSPKRMLSLPRLHEIGHGGHSVCKHGKGFRQNGCFHCRDCTKSTLEGDLYANAARVFAETDAFAAAIAQNRPWRAVCMQTRQGFSPKRMLSLPRLHEIGPGGHSVCKRGKGFRPNGRFLCRNCTKSAMEGILSANVARVFAKTDAFTAAIARNRPWRGILPANVARVFAKTDALTAAIARNRPRRVVCMQTWQGLFGQV